MILNGRKFIRLVSDAPIMGDRNPAASTNLAQPFFIRAQIVLEVIGKLLHPQSRGSEDRRKLLTKIAICKEDRIQAARS